jgi:hypothetical protein
MKRVFWKIMYFDYLTRVYSVKLFSKVRSAINKKVKLKHVENFLRTAKHAFYEYIKHLYS